MHSFEYGQSGRFPEHFLRVHHVADLPGLLRRTVRWLAETRKLAAVKNGRRIWCFRRVDVEQFQRQRTSTAVPPSIDNRGVARTIS